MHSPNGGCSSRQDEKRRLKRVLGLMRLGENPTANAQYHRTVPLYQRSECQFRRPVVGTSVLQKPLKQFAIV